MQIAIRIKCRRILSHYGTVTNAISIQIIIALLAFLMFISIEIAIYGPPGAIIPDLQEILLQQIPCYIPPSGFRCSIRIGCRRAWAAAISPAGDITLFSSAARLLLNRFCRSPNLAQINVVTNFMLNSRLSLLAGDELPELCRIDCNCR